MVANPLYGALPDVDVAQLRALRLASRGDWRGPGCGDCCVRVFAEVMGGGHREVIVAHDGAAHEAYVHALYVPEIVRTGCLTVDLTAARLWVLDEEVRCHRGVLWKVLDVLARRIGTVVLNEDLWRAIHGDDTPMWASPSYFRTTMAHVRKLLGPAAPLIEIRTDIGYMLRAEPPTGPGGEP